MNDTQQKTVIEFALRQLVKPLLKYPDDLEINVGTRNDKFVVEWCANFADQGKILGKQKANLNAIRALMDVVGSKNGFSVRVNDLTPAKVGNPEERQPDKFNPHWEPTKIMDIMREFLETLFDRPFNLKAESAGDWVTIHVIMSKGQTLPVSSGQLAFSLSKIVHAIGRMDGRKVKVNANEATA